MLMPIHNRIKINRKGQARRTRKATEIQSEDILTDGQKDIRELLA